MTSKKVLIIAEAGVNHNGSLELAKLLVDAAKRSGADIVKFQTWITEDLVDTMAPKATYQKINDGIETSQFEMLKKLELSHNDFKELKNYCDEKKIMFLSTPDEEKSLHFLVDKLGMNLIKVGSGEVTNIPYLKIIGAKRKKVILSTGMSTLKEVEKAYKTLLDAGAEKVALLHCTSNYPASFDSINLKAMLQLKTRFGVEYGYSDHSKGTEVSVAAVALGATIIEKHFTLDKNMEGPDHKASMSPDELSILVKQIRNVELAISGSGIKEPTISEIETKKVVQKGLYWKNDFSKGTIINSDNLIAKRPINEVSVEEYDYIIGKKLLKDVKNGNPLKRVDFE